MTESMLNNISIKKIMYIKYIKCYLLYIIKSKIKNVNKEFQ